MAVDAMLEPGTAVPEVADRPAPTRHPPELIGSSREDTEQALAVLRRGAERSVEAESDRGLPVANDMLGRHLAARGSGRLGEGSVTVRSDAGRTAMRGLMLLAQGPGGPRNVGAALIADPLVLLAVGGTDSSVHWSLLPGGRSVTRRADALRLLWMLSSPGELEFGFDAGDPLPPLEFDGGVWPEEQEWRLFEDLATVEEWSGIDLPMPSVVTSDEATRVAQAAGWARSQRVRSVVDGPIRFRVAEEIAVAPDELRLVQDFDVHLLDTDVAMGCGVARVALASASVVHAQREGHWMTGTARDRQITFWLDPPKGRRMPARRTPLSEVPTQALQARKAAVSLPVARRATRSIKSVPIAAAVGTTTADTPALAMVLDEVRADRDL